MTLSSLLTVGQIIPEMKATERWPAITEIVDLLVARNRIAAEYRDSILAALRQREETMSTGIGFGIAIPHASSSKVPHVVAAFGRSTAGIEFGALDHAPVRFLVMFVVPKDQFQIHYHLIVSLFPFQQNTHQNQHLNLLIHTYLFEK
jgi:mannitol/fructose-specific phosphotransferase system IIA component (Ntr-type)